MTPILSNTHFRLIFLICSLFNLFGLFLTIYEFNIDIKKKCETVKDITTTLSLRFLGNESSSFLGNFLHQRTDYYTRDSEKPGFNNSTHWISKRGSCKLRQYTVERVVVCLDILYREDFVLNQKRQLYFVFMGDSRIRQQFYNFLKLIPNYDQKSEHKVIPSAYHGDIEVTSRILRLRVSFLWRPVINETVFKETSQWSIYNQTERPSFILLSMAVHHMMPIPDGDQFKLFQKRLIELGPILGRLANTVNVIWLNQYPTLDLYGERPRNYHIYSEKINRYNKAID